MAGKMTRLEKQWILYDVGNSAFTMLCTTIIPIYFKNIAEAGNLADSDSTAFLSFTLSLSTILVAILGPTIGTMADTKNYKKPLFVSSFLVGRSDAWRWLLRANGWPFSRCSALQERDIS